MNKNIVKKFAEAGLHLQILDKPMRSSRGMEDIVQIDVGRNFKGSSRTEFFRVWWGHEDNVLQVRDTDKKKKQLVLLVKEPEREFEERVRKAVSRKGRSLSRQNILLGRGERLLRENKNEFVVSRKTDGNVRYFLMGVDERQLFVAQLTEPCTTVDQAHRSLGKTVLTADGRRKGSALDRQGEWFFWETDAETRRNIEAAIRSNKSIVKRKTSIGVSMSRGGGNPHIAEELVELTEATAPLEHGFRVRPKQVFVRGSIRHVDHKTIKFKQWREVVANNEGATGRAGASGVLWVD